MGDRSQVGRFPDSTTYLAKMPRRRLPAAGFDLVNDVIDDFLGWVGAVDRMIEEGSGRRLNVGLQRLDEWAETATQVEKNVIYDALFAVLDGTVFRTYRILNDLERTREFFVIVRNNLVIKIRFCDSEEFGIEYIGAPIAPPDRNVDAYYEA